MSKISERISALYGFRIEEGKWAAYLNELDQEGEPTRFNTMRILFILCEELEKTEEKLKLLEESYVKNPETGRDPDSNL